MNYRRGLNPGGYSTFILVPLDVLPKGLCGQFKGQRYIASVCHIISLIEFRKPFTQSKSINCIGIQNNNILKNLFHTLIQTVILKLVMLNYG